MTPSRGRSSPRAQRKQEIHVARTHSQMSQLSAQSRTAAQNGYFLGEQPKLQICGRRRCGSTQSVQRQRGSVAEKSFSLLLFPVLLWTFGEHRSPFRKKL